MSVRASETARSPALRLVADVASPPDDGGRSPIGGFVAAALLVAVAAVSAVGIVRWARRSRRQL